VGLKSLKSLNLTNVYPNNNNNKNNKNNNKKKNNKVKSKPLELRSRVKIVFKRRFLLPMHMMHYNLICFTRLGAISKTNSNFLVSNGIAIVCILIMSSWQNATCVFSNVNASQHTMTRYAVVLLQSPQKMHGFEIF
jgi:hypothetical protein